MRHQHKIPIITGFNELQTYFKVWLFVLTWCKLILVFNPRGSTWEMWLATGNTKWFKFLSFNILSWGHQSSCSLRGSLRVNKIKFTQMLNFESLGKCHSLCWVVHTGTRRRRAAASFNISTVLWKIRVKRFVRIDFPSNSLTVLEQFQ